jgi:hypothetical protein
MKDLSTLTAKHILSINRPEKLFSEPVNVQAEYRELARQWHPDHNPSVDQSIMAKITVLYSEAQKKIKEDAWEVIGVTQIETKDGKKYKIRYHVHRPFELGEMYICDTVLVYLIRKEFKDLADNSRNACRTFKYPNDNLKKEFQKLLPQLLVDSETDSHYFMVFNKTPEIFSARDILNHFKGKIPVVHVAWMLSRLYNIACYMYYNETSNNDISLDSYFIDPKLHSGYLLGGWWYSVPLDKKMIALPERTLSHIPKSVLKKKEGSCVTDSCLIKAIGRELLGDVTGAKLMNDPTIPKPLFNWLQSPGNDKPMEDYTTWMEKILIQSFGKRQFVELKVESQDIYTT